jgi:DNA-binding Lrp family transcriptional regulator
MKTTIFKEAIEGMNVTSKEMMERIKELENEEITLGQILEINREVIESKDYPREVVYFLYGALNFIAREIFETDFVKYEVDDTEIALHEFEVILLANKLPRGQNTIEEILRELDTIENSENLVEKWGYIGATLAFVVSYEPQ